MNRVINRFASTFQYVTPGAGAYDANGRWQAGTDPAPVDFKASIQPMSGRELMLLPEGERTHDRIRIYTDVKLTVAIPAQNQKGTRVSYDGRDWEVQSAFQWDLNDYPYYKYLAQLVEADS